MHIGDKTGGLVFKGGAIGNCECCGLVVPACAYPLLSVTMSWTDADATKQYLGETFTNGESKLICPKSYTCFEVLSPVANFRYGYRAIAGKGETWEWQQFYTGLPSFTHKKKSYKASVLGVTSTVVNTAIETSGTRCLTLINRWTNFRLVWTGATPTQFPTARLQKARMGWIPNNGTVTSKNFFNRRYNRRKKYIGFYTFKKYYTWSRTGVSPPPITTTPSLGTITSAFEGTQTTGSGITISWAKSALGSVQWGAC